MINSSPHAKNYLKYKGDLRIQKAYNIHMHSMHAAVEARFHEEMTHSGWNKQQLKEVRNAWSAAISWETIATSMHAVTADQSLY